MSWLTKSVVLTFGLLSVALTASAEKLYLFTENYPPYNMSVDSESFEHNEESIEGICTEMVKAMLARTDFDYFIKLRDWDYAYNRVQDKPNHGIFCTTYTEDRAPLFKWVGPLAKNSWTLFSPPGSELELNSLEDARGMHIGGYTGDVMSDYMIDKGFEVSTLTTDELNAKRLSLGHIDLWITDELSGPYWAAKEGIEGIVPAFTFNETEVYLAMSKETPDEIIEALNKALQEVKSSPEDEQILQRYGR